MACNLVLPISGTECIGDSRVKINNNFDSLCNAINALSAETVVRAPGGTTSTINSYVIGSGRVLFSDVRNSSLSAVHISNEAITTDKIALSAVTADKISLDTGLSSNGFQKMPGNLILQWGSGSGNTFNFPVIFPTSLLHLQLTVNQFNALSSIPGQYTTTSATTVSGFSVVAPASALDGTATLKYIALGC